jgi:hypothetical protein
MHPKNGTDPIWKMLSPDPEKTGPLIEYQTSNHARPKRDQCFLTSKSRRCALGQVIRVQLHGQPVEYQM